MRDVCIEKYDLWLTQPEFYVWRQHGISFMLCVAGNHAFVNKNTGWRHYGPKNRLHSIVLCLSQRSQTEEPYVLSS